MVKRLVWIGLALAAGSVPALAENWPMWRGPDGNGTTVEKDLPMEWSDTENVSWKVPLPDPGNSTPVVWGGRIFVTQSVETMRWLMCFDRKDGALLWKEGVLYKGEDLTHKTNPHASSSPATDGEIVVVYFGSAGLHAFDLSGKKLWSRDLGVQRHIWGYGASPVIRGDFVYLNYGPGENQGLVALDKATGEVLWKHEEAGGSSGEAGGKTWLGSWGDPMIRFVGDHEELFIAYPGRVRGFDPKSGEELWVCEGLNPLVYTSVNFADGLVLAMGGYNGNAVAVKAGGYGDVTQTHRVWLKEKTRQRIGSGVIHEGHIYILTDSGIAECRSMETGELVWEERVKGPGPTGQNWSSLVLSADGLCYAVNQGGDSFVFRASPKFELLATNPMGERIIGSVAVSDGQLFIRGHEHLFCIGERK